MDPVWSETCRSTIKYFIILIVSTCYILCTDWIAKCLTPRSSLHPVGFIWKKIIQGFTVNRTWNTVATKIVLEIFRTVLHSKKILPHQNFGRLLIKSWQRQRSRQIMQTYSNDPLKHRLIKWDIKFRDCSRPWHILTYFITYLTIYLIT